MHKTQKILIVDDEPRNLRILAEILEDECIFAQAQNGEEALMQVDVFRPDLVLLDGMMPGKTGLEVCQQLKASAATAHIKVIFVTGKASSTEREEGFAAGADGYMVKPFEEEALRAEIERVLVCDE